MAHLTATVEAPFKASGFTECHLPLELTAAAEPDDWAVSLKPSGTQCVHARSAGVILPDLYIHFVGRTRTLGFWGSDRQYYRLRVVTCARLFLLGNSLADSQSPAVVSAAEQSGVKWCINSELRCPWCRPVSFARAVLAARDSEALYTTAALSRIHTVLLSSMCVRRPQLIKAAVYWAPAAWWGHQWRAQQPATAVPICDHLSLIICKPTHGACSSDTKWLSFYSTLSSLIFHIQHTISYVDLVHNTELCISNSHSGYRKALPCTCKRSNMT